MRQRRENRRRRRIGSGCAVCAVVLVLLWSEFTPTPRGQEVPSLGEQHRASAGQYRQEAAALREAITRHQISLDVYRKGSEEPNTAGFNPQGRKRMVEHCQRLIADYTEAAKELEAMAAEHEALAKEASVSPPESE